MFVVAVNKADESSKSDPKWQCSRSQNNELKQGKELRGSTELDYKFTLVSLQD